MATPRFLEAASGDSCRWHEGSRRIGANSAWDTDGGGHDERLVARIHPVPPDLGGDRLLAGPGRRRKGHSFLGYFIFSLFFFLRR